jgi:hypothetical protein
MYGINYKTNRKITIGGKIHELLKERFMINSRFRYVLFEDLEYYRLKYIIKMLKIL